MRLFLTLSITLTLVASFAWAYDPTPEDLERFQGYLQEGGNLLDAGSYQEAIDELLKARDIIDHPRISLSIAGAYRDWGRCTLASHEYEALQRRDELSDDAGERLERGLSRLENCIPMGVLTIHCDPDARLQIDGAEYSCPFEDEREVADYQITVSQDGFETRETILSLDDEGPTQLRLHLEPKSEPESPDLIAIAGYSAIGLGSALLLGGGFSDFSSRNRTDEIAAAHLAGDNSRVDTLRAEAGSARLRTAVLYGAGALVLTTGVVLQFIDFGSTDSDTPQAGLTFGVSPTGVSTTLTW